MISPSRASLVSLTFSKPFQQKKCAAARIRVPSVQNGWRDRGRQKLALKLRGHGKRWRLWSILLGPGVLSSAVWTWWIRSRSSNFSPKWVTCLGEHTQKKNRSCICMNGPPCMWSGKLKTELWGWWCGPKSHSCCYLLASTLGGYLIWCIAMLQSNGYGCQHLLCRRFSVQAPALDLCLPSGRPLGTPLPRQRMSWLCKGEMP